MNYKIIILFLFVFIFGLSTGFIIDKFLIKEQVNRRDSQNTFESGWNAAREALKERGYLQENYENIEIKMVSGKVSEISDNKIYLNIKPLEALSDPDLDSRILVIDQSTEFLRVVRKSEAEYQKEIDMLKSSGEFKVVPDSPDGQVGRHYLEKTFFGDIKIGDQVVVESYNDLKYEKEFLVKKITVTNI